MLATATRSGSAPCSLTCWFTRGNGDSGPTEWLVERVYVRNDELTNGVYYTEPVEMDGLLSRAFIEAVKSYLPAHFGEQVLTAREVILELPDLLLGHLRVTASVVSNDAQRVILTFRTMIGKVARLFAPGKAPPLQSNRADEVADSLFEKYAAPVAALRESLDSEDPGEALSQMQFELEVLRSLEVEVSRQIERVNLALNTAQTPRMEGWHMGRIDRD